MRTKYTVVTYMYRDAGNWKRFSEAYVRGALKVEQLEPYLQGDSFIPGDLGLPGLEGSDMDQDHPWHEFLAFEHVAALYKAQDFPPPTAKQFVKLAKTAHENGWPGQYKSEVVQVANLKDFYRELKRLMAEYHLEEPI